MSATPVVIDSRAKLSGILAYMFPIFLRAEFQRDTEQRLADVLEKNGIVTKEDLLSVATELYQRQLSDVGKVSGGKSERNMIFVGLAAVAMAAVCIGAVYYMME